MTAETSVYRGQTVTVLVIRPRDGSETIALVCDDLKECKDYERLFQSGPPYKLDHSTPLGRKLKKHYSDIVLEVLEPPIKDGGWPWIVALYTPKPLPGGQRDHWALEAAGDRDEAQTIAHDIQQAVERRTKRLGLSSD